jgi:hypothetical protein
MDDEDLRRALIDAAARVQAMPYAWPVPPDAAAARDSGCGSCSSKHALLAEDLAALGISSHPLFVAGPLLPPGLAHEPEFATGAALLEVHECLTILTPWAGPLRVDVTWDPPLVRRGLPGTLDWDGRSDMAVAVGEGLPSWAPPRDNLRAAKVALRARLYTPGEREVRDRVLTAMVRRFEEWRRSAPASESAP